MSAPYRDFPLVITYNRDKVFETTVSARSKFEAKRKAYDAFGMEKGHSLMTYLDRKIQVKEPA